MGLIYDLEVRKDVKGGSPRTPTPVPMSAREYQEESHGTHGVSAVWRTVAVACATCMVTLCGAIFTVGIDNVKHSEIDSIMSARAPYMHDKERIWGKMEDNAKRIEKLETIARDDFDKRIRDLEQKKE